MFSVLQILLQIVNLDQTVLLVALTHRLGEGDIAGFQVELGFGRRAEDLGSIVVEVSFPPCDHDRGKPMRLIRESHTPHPSASTRAALCCDARR
jgi:hypothetical protein